MLALGCGEDSAAAGCGTFGNRAPAQPNDPRRLAPALPATNTNRRTASYVSTANTPGRPPNQCSEKVSLKSGRVLLRHAAAKCRRSVACFCYAVYTPSRQSPTAAAAASNSRPHELDRGELIPLRIIAPSAPSGLVSRYRTSSSPA